MKKILLAFICLVIVSAVLFQFYLIPKAQSNIEKYFASIGFKNIEVHDTQFTLNGLNIVAIKLDKDGFDEAQNIKVKIFWPSYILKSTPALIEIDTLKISSVANTISDVINYKYFINLKKLENIAVQDISVKKLIWDIATPQNALRLEGDFRLKNENGQSNFKANLNGAQHELSMTSQWDGNFTPNGDYNIEGIFDNLNVNNNVLKIKRGTGWITFKNQGEQTDTTAQLDAGSGDILNIPVNNISLLLSQKDDSYPVLLRTTASDIQDVNLYGDFKFSKNIESQAFDVLLEIKDPNLFANYLKQQNIIKDAQKGTNYPTGQTNIYLSYDPQNRFADGPFPFSIKSTQNGEDNLAGTFLIYPSKLDLRGTAQGDNDIIAFMQTLLMIDNKDVSDGNIRLEKNLKSLF